MTAVSYEFGREWLPRPEVRGEARIGNSGLDHSPVADLAKYECLESDDDYRHRMIMNAIALVFTSLLILAGVWLANMMPHA